MAKGRRAFEVEKLTVPDRFNEYVMTGLRTIWGVSIERIKAEFGLEFEAYLLKRSSKFVLEGFLKMENRVLTTTPKGKFLADGLASDLFYLD